MGECRWRVKVIGVALSSTPDNLSDQFDVPTRRVTIPEGQSASSRSYALIDGFVSQEHASTFVEEWNDAFSHARIGIRCELDSTEARSIEGKNEMFFHLTVELRTIDIFC